MNVEFASCSKAYFFDSRLTSDIYKLCNLRDVYVEPVAYIWLHRTFCLPLLKSVRAVSHILVNLIFLF